MFGSQIIFTNNIEKIMYTKKTFLKFHYTDTAGILFFSKRPADLRDYEVINMIRKG